MTQGDFQVIFKHRHTSEDMLYIKGEDDDDTPESVSDS